MISPRLVAQKPQIDDNFPGNKTLALGSEVTMECPIILNDSFDPAEMWWFKVTEKLVYHIVKINYLRTLMDFNWVL